MLVTHRPETIFQGWLYLTFCLWWVCARIVLLFLMKVLEVLLYLCFWLEVLGIFSLCGVTESVRNFAAHCLLGQFCYIWTFLLKIWQFYYIYPIFKMLLFYPIFLFFVPHLFAKSVANFGAPFIFAEWMFWVTLTSYWELGIFFYMLRAC